MPVDISDWGRASAERRASVARAVNRLRTLPLQAAQLTATEARSRVSTHPSWVGLVDTIRADQIGPMSADVGYERRGIGKLVHIAERGSARKAPHPAMIPASDLGERFFEAESMRAIDGVA